MALRRTHYPIKHVIIFQPSPWRYGMHDGGCMVCPGAGGVGEEGGGGELCNMGLSSVVETGLHSG